MKLTHVLVILLVATSAYAKSLLEIRSDDWTQELRSNEEILLSKANDDVSDVDVSFFDFYDDISCSFDGQYLDIDFQMFTDAPEAIPSIDDIKSNIEFTLTDMMISVEGYIEVLQETIDYIFDYSSAILQKAVLNIEHDIINETFDPANNVQAYSLPYISQNLLNAMNAVKLNINSTVSENTDLVTKIVNEVTSSINKQTDQVIDDLNRKVARLENISEQESQNNKAAVEPNSNSITILTAQENIESVFSPMEEAVEIGVNQLMSNFENFVSDFFLCLKDESDRNEAMNILNNIFRGQLQSLQVLLSEAVVVARIATVETLFNSAASINVEILIAAESIDHSYFNIDAVGLNDDDTSNNLIEKSLIATPSPEELD